MNLCKLNSLRMGSATIILDFNCDSVHVQTNENYSLNLPNYVTRDSIGMFMWNFNIFKIFNKDISHLATVPHVLDFW